MKPDAAVTLPRADVDYVVIEYGCVHLRRTSISKRVELLTSIAHPKFRNQLKKEAIEIGYISKQDQTVIFGGLTDEAIKDFIDS